MMIEQKDFDTLHAYLCDTLAEPASTKAHAFLSECGIDLDAAKAWGLGYVSPDTAQLSEILQTVTSDDDVATLQAALENIRGRLTFACRDAEGVGRCIAGRRVGPTATEAKYTFPFQGPAWTSPPTILYGLDRASPAIIASGTAILVEGFTDVIACHLAGLDNVVGMCGTAPDDRTTHELARLLGRHEGSNTEIVVVADGDAAGTHLLSRVPRLLACATTSIAACPKGEDPCSLRASDGGRALLQVINDRSPVASR